MQSWELWYLQFSYSFHACRFISHFILTGLITPAVTREDRLHNMQVLVDTLATDVLGMDLSHIQASEIVDGDVAQVGNLVEIFDGLLEIVLEQIEKESVDHECNGSKGL